MSIELKLLEENELRNIKLNIDDIDKNLIFNPISTYSITIDKKIIGLITFFDWYPNHVAISIIVDKRYRGKGIAGIALEKVIDLHGRNNTSINRFLYNVSQKNKSSIRVMEKLNWDMTNNYDEDMLKEGTNFYIVYYKENPYYKKGKVKTYDNK